MYTRALAYLPYQLASPCSPLQINHPIQAGLLHVTQQTEASCLVRNFSLLQSPPKIYFRVPVSDLNYASPSALRQFCCRCFPFTLRLYNIRCYQTPPTQDQVLETQCYRNELNLKENKQAEFIRHSLYARELQEREKSGPPERGSCGAHL